MMESSFESQRRHDESETTPSSGVQSAKGSNPLALVAANHVVPAVTAGGKGITTQQGSCGTSNTTTQNNRFHFVLSVTSLLVLVAGIVVLCGTVVAFAAVFVPVESQNQLWMQRFSTNAVDSILFRVARRYESMFRLGVFANTLGNQSDPLLDNLAVAVGGGMDPHTAVKWLGQDALHLQLQYVIVNQNRTGFIIGPYSIFLKDEFPEVPNCVVVQRVNASADYVDIGYYSLESYLPINSSWPLKRVFNQYYNFTNRPYGVAMEESLTWSAPYVGVYSQTSSLGLGGPYWSNQSSCRIMGSGCNPATRSGVVSLHDYTTDANMFIHSLNISNGAIAFLVDVQHEAVLWGTLSDNSTITTSVNTRRVELLSDIRDVKVRPLIEAGQQMLLTCTAPCSLVFYPSTGKLESDGATTTFGLFDDVQVVRVSSLSDGYGLDLRLVFILPSAVLASPLRRGAILGMAISGSVVIVLLFAVFLGVRTLVMPLQFMETLLLGLAKSGSRRIPGTAITASLGDSSSSTRSSPPVQVEAENIAHGMTRAAAQQKKLLSEFMKSDGRWKKTSPLTEITALQEAVSRLTSEMMVFASFLPTIRLHAHDSMSMGDSQTGGSADMLQVRGDSNSVSDSITRVGPTSASPGGANRMYTAESIWRTLVTFVIVNVEGFQRVVDSLLPSDVLKMHHAYISAIDNATKNYGGVLERFYGDHAWIHFNAAKRVVGHAANAARAVSMIETELQTCSQSDAFRSGVHFGISTSPAVCGMFGSRDMISFHVLGQCVLQAFSLCWQGKVDRRTTLMSWRSTQLMSTAKDVHPQHVRLALLPYETKASIVSTPLVISKHNSGNSGGSDAEKPTSSAGPSDMHTSVLPHALGVDVGTSSPRRVTPKMVSSFRDLDWSTAAVRDSVSISNAAYESFSMGDRVHARQLLLTCPLLERNDWLVHHLLADFLNQKQEAPSTTPSNVE